MLLHILSIELFNLSLPDPFGKLLGFGTHFTNYLKKPNAANNQRLFSKQSTKLLVFNTP